MYHVTDDDIMPVKHKHVCVCLVDYSLETIVLKWIHPRHKAVEFDDGGKDDSQFSIKNFVLQNCSYNSTGGLTSTSNNCNCNFNR